MSNGTNLQTVVIPTAAGGYAVVKLDATKLHFDATQTSGYDSEQTSTVFVILGAIAVIVIIILAVLCYLCRKKSPKDEPNPTGKQFPNIQDQEADPKKKESRSGAYAVQNLEKSELSTPYEASKNSMSASYMNAPVININ